MVTSEVRRLDLVLIVGFVLRSSVVQLLTLKTVINMF